MNPSIEGHPLQEYEEADCFAIDDDEEGDDIHDDDDEADNGGNGNVCSG